MYDFISYLSKRDSDLWLNYYETISEMSVAEVEARKPKDGDWIDPSHYGFNVEGDDCNSGGGTATRYCYVVNINHGNISFTRKGNYGDVRGGFGNKVFDGVRYAILEYIQNNKPEYLSWSPLRTSTPNPVTGKVTNPEGRKSVYEIFAIKSLFPEMYVSAQVNHWMRRDLYDKLVAEKKYPAIPTNLTNQSNPSEKKKMLEKIRTFHNETGNSFSSSASSNQPSPSQPADPLGRTISDFALRSLPYNRANNRIHHFHIGDFVILKIHSTGGEGMHPVSNATFPELYRYNNKLQDIENLLHNNQTNKLSIQNFYTTHRRDIGEWDAEFAKVNVENSNRAFIVNLNDIEPYTQEHRNSLNVNRYLNLALQNPQFNPHRYKVGDYVLHQQGAIGKITNIRLYDNNDLQGGVIADVDWDENKSLQKEISMQYVRGISFILLSDRLFEPATQDNISYMMQRLNATMQPHSQGRRMTIDGIEVIDHEDA